MEEVVAHFKARDGAIHLTLTAGGMVIQFDYSREAANDENAMALGMPAIYDVLCRFSGEEEAKRAMRALYEKICPTRN